MINDLVVERSNLSEGSMTYHTTEKGKYYLEMYEDSKVYDLTSNTYVFGKRTNEDFSSL